MPVPNKNVTGRTKSGTGVIMMTIRIPVTGLGWAGADWGMGGRCASVLANRCSPRRGVGGSPATSSFPADCEGVRCPPNYSSFFFLCFFAFSLSSFFLFPSSVFLFSPCSFLFPCARFKLSRMLSPPADGVLVPTAGITGVIQGQSRQKEKKTQTNRPATLVLLGTVRRRRCLAFGDGLRISGGRRI